MVEGNLEGSGENGAVALNERDGATAGAAREEAFIEEALPSELSDVQAKSIIESILFASAHPVSFAALKALFGGTNIDAEKLWDMINLLQTDYAGGERGISLEEVAGGYQLRTKLDNAGWLKKLVKARPFRLSGPALEVLSIIAYKQPVIKAEIDEIRGVESGHLVRALMEKNLVRFAGKSDLPGKPMLYATTKSFLELFGLRNIRELPTLSEIDKLIPEGIGEGAEVEGGETLGTLADKIAIAPGQSYSESENELLSITETLSEINTSTDFFEQEKIRERERRDQERAQDLRERMVIGEQIPEVDTKWLARYEAKIAEAARVAAEARAAAEAQAAAAEAQATAETRAQAEEAQAARAAVEAPAGSAPDVGGHPEATADDPFSTEAGDAVAESVTEAAGDAAKTSSDIAKGNAADVDVAAVDGADVEANDSASTEAETREADVGEAVLTQVMITKGTDIEDEPAASPETTTVAVAHIATDTEEFEEAEIEIQMVNAEEAALAAAAAEAGLTRETPIEQTPGVRSTEADRLAIDTEEAVTEAAARTASKKKKSKQPADDDVNAKARVSAATMAAEAHLAAFMDDDGSDTDLDH